MKNQPQPMQQGEVDPAKCSLTTEKTSCSSPNDWATMLETEFEGVLSVFSNSDLYADGSEVRARERAAKISDQIDPMAEWMGQFNDNRVAKVLIERGAVDEKLAQRAGEAVQAQALARTARRRVREFLKERDRVFGGSDWNPFAELNEPVALPVTEDFRVSTKSSVMSEAGKNNVENVVDLCLNYGLNVKDVSEILIHSPGIAFMSPRAREDGEGASLQETLDRAFVGLLRDTLKLRKYDARKVLRNTPGLLSMRGSHGAEQIVILLERLGVSTNSIARDKNNLPMLLSRSPAAVFRLVSFLSSDVVRMPTREIGPLLRRSECRPLLDAIAPVERISDTQQFDLTCAGVDVGMENMDPEVESALWGRRRNQIIKKENMNYLYSGMRQTAATLRSEIGTADLGRVISAYPAVLLLDAKTQILPTANYLIHELGIWEDDLPRVLELYPTLFNVGYDQMEEVSSYLIDLDVAPDSLGSIFRSFPALLKLDVETQIIPVVKFLRSIGVSNVGRVISRLPPVLGYSVERELRPKWEFLRTVCLDPQFEIARFPACLSYPLERVIKARFEYLRNVKRMPTQFVPVDLVLRYGDRDFATKVANDMDEGLAFSEFCEKRRRKTNRRKSGSKARDKATRVALREKVI